jgi:hypothetical protein
MSLIDDRQQRVRGYLELPVALHTSCECLKPGDRATMCADHPEDGFMCLGHWGAHWSDVHHDAAIICDACGGENEWEDYAESIVEETASTTWSGVVDTKIRALCVNCADRLAAVRTVIDLRIEQFDKIVKRWLAAGAPGHELSDRFGWCPVDAFEIRTYDQLLVHLATEHDAADELCAACQKEPGTVPRTPAITVTEVGPVHVEALAVLCDLCDRAERGGG